MPRYFAFLRAINVGGRTVRMEQLRVLFGEMGFANVETFIASGNVVFDARARSATGLERTIEAHLRKALGYDVNTFVRSAGELAAIVNRDAFPPADVAAAHALYVAFLGKTPAPAVRERLSRASTAADEFALHGRELYWLCRVRFSDSAFSGPPLEKATSAPVTVRNMTTLRKLAARFGVV
jgi:uncharacterized protein (DUF1697 family)